MPTWFRRSLDQSIDPSEVHRPHSLQTLPKRPRKHEKTQQLIIPTSQGTASITFSSCPTTTNEIQEDSAISCTLCHGRHQDQDLIPLSETALPIQEMRHGCDPPMSTNLEALQDDSLLGSCSLVGFRSLIQPGRGLLENWKTAEWFGNTTD